MVAAELRIGNYVKLKDESFALEVREVNSKTITATSTTLSYCEYEPIPLTEEWLVAFGFEKNAGSTSSINKKWVYYEFIDSIRISVELIRNTYQLEYSLNTGWGDYEILGKQFQHVHQLQNLYFALTGEELILK